MKIDIPDAIITEIEIAKGVTFEEWLKMNVISLRKETAQAVVKIVTTDLGDITRSK